MVIIIDASNYGKIVRDMVKLLIQHGAEANDAKSYHIGDEKSEAKSRNQGTSEHSNISVQSNTAKQQAIQLLKAGRSVDEVVKTTGLKKPTIRAYKAHLTMGTYT